MQERSYYGSAFRQALKHSQYKLKFFFYSCGLNWLANELDFLLSGLRQTEKLSLCLLSLSHSGSLKPGLCKTKATSCPWLSKLKNYNDIKVQIKAFSHDSHISSAQSLHVASTDVEHDHPHRLCYWTATHLYYQSEFVHLGSFLLNSIFVSFK